MVSKAWDALRRGPEHVRNIDTVFGQIVAATFENIIINKEGTKTYEYFEGKLVHLKDECAATAMVLERLKELFSVRRSATWSSNDMDLSLCQWRLVSNGPLR